MNCGLSAVGDRGRERGLEKKRKRRIGDRKDGRLIRTLPPLNAMIPFIMKVKSESSNFFADSVEISETERYLRGKRINGYPGMGYLHLFVAAYVRVVSQYPAINRFVSGQRVYARRNIEYNMVVKKEMKAESPETSLSIIFSPADTIDDVYRKLNAEIDKIKGGDDTDADDISAALMKLPRLLLKFVVWFLNLLDYFGLLPKVILKASPFHGSVIITDLGSIGLPTIFHHVYDFGNMPLFVSFGAKYKKYEPLKDGSVVKRKYIDYTLVMDERICDGFYFSQVYRMFKSILKDPETLNEPPDMVVEDID